jgi:hypothetical protein
MRDISLSCYLVAESVLPDWFIVLFSSRTMLPDGLRKMLAAPSDLYVIHSRLLSGGGAFLLTVTYTIFAFPTLQKRKKNARLVEADHVR